MLVEQAVFTSVQSSRANGYQLVARSPGVGDSDAQELRVASPSHDALVDQALGATSVQFYRLPSGRYCVARSTLTGGEQSGRGGGRVYTHSLVVPPDVLQRFSHNPFAVLRAATAAGAMQVPDTAPAEIEPLRLMGRAVAIDPAVYSDPVLGPDLTWLPHLVSCAIREPRVVIVAERARERLVEALVTSLPVECRTAFSLATGLRFSLRHAWRIHVLPPDPKEQRKLRRPDWRVLDLTLGLPSEPTPMHGWPGLVAAAQRHRGWTEIKIRLTDQRPGLSLGDLDTLGEQWLAELGWGSRSAPGSVQVLARLGPLPPPLGEMVADLAKRPEDEAIWVGWRQAHRNALVRRRPEQVRELVQRACQVYGFLGRISPESVQRLGDLFTSQLAHDRRTLNDTIRHLRNCADLPARETWLHLAEQVRDGLWRPVPSAETQEASPPLETLVPPHVAANPLFKAAAAEVRSHRADTGHAPPTSKSREAPEQPGPAQSLGRRFPSAQGCLQQLEDALFEALAGKATAVGLVRKLWPETLQQVGRAGWEPCQEGYLRHVLQAWQHCIDESAKRDPRTAIAALDLIGILLGPGPA